MNPFYDAGTFCTGPACEPCKKCGSNPCSCHKCDEHPCGCPEPVMGIDKVPTKPATYRFNINGRTTRFDFAKGIYDAQTDTSLIADVVDRLLRFSAERHTDTITAQELGSILHIADLGDVNTQGAEDGALMVYQKSNTCGEGCVGTANVWKAWNALDSQQPSVAYPAGFDSKGNIASIQQPANPTQYYNLGWNGANQLSFAQPTEETAVIPDTDGYAYQMYLNPITKQPYYVKVKVS